MKNIIGLALLLLLVDMNAMDTPIATPADDHDFPRKANIWIPGGTPVESQIPQEIRPGFFGETVLRILSKEPQTENLTVKYEFESDCDGRYEFFAALLTQGRVWSSPVLFSFDQHAWQPIPGNYSRVKPWGISNAVTWNSLGEVNLNKGKHTLRLRIAKRTFEGKWSFICDGIAGFLTVRPELRFAPPVSPLPYLDANPQTRPELPDCAAIWIDGGSSVRTNIPEQRKERDAFSRKISYLNGKDIPPEGFWAEYRFEVKENREYVLFATLITQGRPWGSPVEFRLDESPWFMVRPNPAGRRAWGISNALTWDYLDTQYLKTGKHTLTFRIKRPSEDGNFSFMCDGIVGFEKNIGRNGDFSEYPIR